MVLVGTAGAGAADQGAAHLAVSRHIPAHAPTGGRVQQSTPARTQRQGQCASAHLHNSAPCRMAQTHIQLTGTGLHIIRTQQSTAQRKRYRTPHIGEQGSTEKRLRTLTHAADAACTGKRRRPGKVAQRPKLHPGGAKRKHSSTHGKQRANGGLKRKSAAGMTQMLSATPAHCHGSSANCDAHSAGGSMRVGNATPVKVLRTTVMRPVG